jgi:uncharacterized protein YbaR (Trm112 family)
VGDRLAIVLCPNCRVGLIAQLTAAPGATVLICPDCGPVLYRATFPTSDPIAIYVPRAKRRKRYPLQPPRRSGRPRKAV